MPRNPDKIDYSGGLPIGFENFVIIEDPRIGGNKRHHFGEIIFIAVSALVCGVKSYSGIAEFSHIHEHWLRKWIGLPNGIPVVQTFINVFSLIDPKIFSRCIVNHISEIYPDLAKQLIAVDGKTLRGSGSSTSEQEHCLSAWAADSGLTLALEFVRKKSNEIPAIPLLLEQLELKGHVVSLDAMGTQTHIAKTIIEKEGDYLMALKRNQGTLHDEVIDQFHFASIQISKNKSEAWDLYETSEKSNGRVCTRRLAVTNQLDWMQHSVVKRWKNLSSLVMLETQTYSLATKTTSTQKRYYISSLDTSAKVLNKLIRQHWSIENQCHWVLDTLYREDHSQIRQARAAQNFSILRRLSLNMLKEEQSIKKSLPMKQMRAMGDSTYREKVLSLAG